MKKIIFSILILGFVSCNFITGAYGIWFTIINESDFAIKNVNLTTLEHLNKSSFDKIEANKKVSGFLCMKENKTDGDYILEFIKQDGIKETKDFGYYTNGTALNSRIEITIKNDTVITKFY